MAPSQLHSRHGQCSTCLQGAHKAQAIKPLMEAPTLEVAAEQGVRQAQLSSEMFGEMTTLGAMPAGEETLSFAQSSSVSDKDHP